MVRLQVFNVIGGPSRLLLMPLPWAEHLGAALVVIIPSAGLRVATY